MFRRSLISFSKRLPVSSTRVQASSPLTWTSLFSTSVFSPCTRCSSPAPYPSSSRLCGCFALFASREQPSRSLRVGSVSTSTLISRTSPASASSSTASTSGTSREPTLPTDAPSLSTAPKPASALPSLSTYRSAAKGTHPHPGPSSSVSSGEKVLPVKRVETVMPPFPWISWGLYAGTVAAAAFYFGLVGPNWRLPTEEEKVQWAALPTPPEEDD
mmetsp:Transcript_16144/g.41452  ORF Transcript_16144/g.41452 Transcript_16144/m.41452 type:complete len:215 (+) Transcript_16144:112-756(+)